MAWMFFFILQALCPTLSALFTVEVERQSYQAQFGRNVTMGCRFKLAAGGGSPDLTVIWHRVQPGPTLEVYRLENGQEDLQSQDITFRGRARLEAKELVAGWAKLEVTQLRISDSGTYQCQVEMNGADYKQTVLSVRADYTTVIKFVKISKEGDEVELSCQSTGFPLASVIWMDGTLRKVPANTTSVRTLEQLFQVTSRLKVKSSNENNYTCVFEEGGGLQGAQSARFYIPDEIPKLHRKSNAWIIASITCLAVAVIISAGILYYRRQKDSRERGTLSTKNLLVHSEGYTDTAACLRSDTQVEEQTATYLSEECKERVENLKAALRACYIGGSTDEEVRGRLSTFCEAELPRRLRNIKGQPVSVQALLPDTRGTVLLEGQRGSGKTTLTKSLSSSWALGQCWDPFNLQHLQLLLVVNCENATEGDLTHQMMLQHSLGAELSGEELWTVMGGSEVVLLVLDGYREGQNRVMDESLFKLLRERRACRVLVMAQPGHCPVLRDRVAAGGTVLQLLTEPVEH